MINFVLFRFNNFIMSKRRNIIDCRMFSYSSFDFDKSKLCWRFFFFSFFFLSLFFTLFTSHSFVLIFWNTFISFILIFSGRCKWTLSFFDNFIVRFADKIHIDKFVLEFIYQSVSESWNNVS